MSVAATILTCERRFNIVASNCTGTSVMDKDFPEYRLRSLLAHLTVTGMWRIRYYLEKNNHGALKEAREKGQANPHYHSHAYIKLE